MEQKKTTPLDQAAIQGAELMKNPPKNPYKDYRSELQKLIDGGREKNAELQHDERLAKVHEAVAGLSDAGRAIANFIGTTQGAPNAYADSGLSDKARERVEKARAEREKNRDALLNYQYQIGKLNENERSWKERLRHNRELLGIQRDKVKVQEEAARYKAEETARKEQEAAEKTAAESHVVSNQKGWYDLGRNGDVEGYNELGKEYKRQLEAGEITPIQYNIYGENLYKFYKEGEKARLQALNKQKPKGNTNGKSPYRSDSTGDEKKPAYTQPGNSRKKKAY